MLDISGQTKRFFFDLNRITGITIALFYALAWILNYPAYYGEAGIDPMFLIIRNITIIISTISAVLTAWFIYKFKGYGLNGEIRGFTKFFAWLQLAMHWLNYFGVFLQGAFSNIQKPLLVMLLTATLVLLTTLVYQPPIKLK